MVKHHIYALTLDGMQEKGHLSVNGCFVGNGLHDPMNSKGIEGRTRERNDSSVLNVSKSL